MAAAGRQIDDDDGGDGGVEDGILAEQEDADDITTPAPIRALASAASHYDVDALRLALDNLNGSIDQPVEDGDSALHLACLYGSFDCVKLLIERGANIEVKDEDGAIPLHDACASGYYEIVEFLLNGAASPDQKKRMLDTADYEGDTPLHHAARGDHDYIIKLLLDNGACPTTKNAYDKIPYDLVEPPSSAIAVFEEAAHAAAAQ